MFGAISEENPPKYVAFSEIDNEGFIVDEHIFVEGEEPKAIPSDWIRELVPDFVKPKWNGEKWIEAGEKKPLFVPVKQEPTELELLQQENEQLKTEIEQHKTEANVATQAIFELALEIESLKGGA